MSSVPSTCIVVGGSFAGTLAAAAAAPFFDRVLVLDRDKLETRLENLKRNNLDYAALVEEAGKHRSVYQEMQMHVMLSGGIQAVEKLLPGFKRRCKESGAIHGGSECVFGKNLKMNWGNGWMTTMPAPEGYALLMGTRVMLERCARAVLVEHYKQVEFCMPCKVEDVLYDSQSRTVQGVQLSSGEVINGDFVIDSTGGRSHMIMQFLERECGQKVKVIKHHVNLSYHTRFFKIPDKVLQQPPEDRTWLCMVAARAPQSDGGMYQTVEGGMYQALVARMNGEKCGPRLEDFMDLLKSLPDQDVYETLKDAEPLGPSLDCLGLKGTERYFYEDVDMPESYVVLGDALAHLNPRFGSGITSSALQAGMLRDTMALASEKSQRTRPSTTLTAQQLQGYSNKIQKAAAKVVELPYTLVRDGDLQYDFCTGPRPTNPLAGVTGAYLGGVMDLLPHSKEVAATWIMVTSFLRPPTDLFKAAIVKEVLMHLMMRKWTGLSSPARLFVTAFGLLLPVAILAAVLKAF